MSKRLTLIEVILVFTLSLLLAALVPALLPARECGGHRRRCINNLKQIGLSMRMYSAVYDEDFPHLNGRTGLQMLAMEGFLENTQVYACPNTMDKVADTTSISSQSSFCYAGGLTEENSVDSALAADRANNHDRFGYILFVDGHVKGYAGVNWSTNRGGSHLTDF